LTFRFGRPYNRGTVGSAGVPQLEALGGLANDGTLNARNDASRQWFRRPGTGNTLGELRAMLVLSRKKNETIIIDDHIVITVVEIRGDKVRLGIEAPKEIPIHRSEVHAAIHSEQSTTIPEHKTGEQDPPKVTSAGS
jgi:carbon storage regulator